LRAAMRCAKYVPGIASVAKEHRRERERERESGVLVPTVWSVSTRKGEKNCVNRVYLCVKEADMERGYAWWVNDEALARATPDAKG